MSSTDVTLDADVVVVGAGMSGLYALKVLRERGLRTIVLEKAPGVGGTWYWNRYPGARCDIPSLEYSFGFDPELEQEWEWTEHFASQPEIERYLNHITDRYDLRRDIRLSCGVTAATFDEATDTWVFDTETGDRLRSRFVIMATGGLSAPHRPDWPAPMRARTQRLLAARAAATEVAPVTPPPFPADLFAAPRINKHLMRALQDVAIGF